LEKTDIQVALKCDGYADFQSCLAEVVKKDAVFKNCQNKLKITNAAECVEHIKSLFANGTLKPTSTEDEFVDECKYQKLNLEKGDKNSKFYCPVETEKCLTAENLEGEIERLKLVFTKDLVELLQNGEKSNMGKSIGIGAAAGAGVGGLVTAITAAVEGSNINCRVGDGLAQVGLNKSHSIDSLRDIYVKWNLNLPETAAPTALVDDCQSWKNTCAAFLDMNHCRAAQFNYKPAGASSMTLVPSACTVSGSVCIENYPVAKSHGACE